MPGHGVTVAEAARALGISEAAVKKRLQRGTLAGDKSESGQWRVVLEMPLDAPVAPQDGPDSRDDTVTPPGSHDEDNRGDTGIPPSPQWDDTALVEQLRSEVAFLREQLTNAQQAEAEQRRIIAGLLARLPEVAAPGMSGPHHVGTPSTPDDPDTAARDDDTPPASPPVQASPPPLDTVIPMPPASSPPVEPAALAPAPEQAPSPPAWNLQTEPHRSIEESLGLAPLATVPVERPAERRPPWWRRLFGR